MVVVHGVGGWTVVDGVGAGAGGTLMADHRHPPGVPSMTLTPGLTLLGLVLVLVAIPLAFSLAPLVIGAIILVYATRRAHLGLAEPRAATQTDGRLTAARRGPVSGRRPRPARRVRPLAMAGETPSA